MKLLMTLKEFHVREEPSVACGCWRLSYGKMGDKMGDSVLGGVMALSILALIVDLGFVDSARAQANNNFEASYAISVGILRIGSVMVAADFADGEYTISANGRTGGFVRVLSSGQGSYMTHGTIREGRLAPERFASQMIAGSEMLEVMMLFDNGNVEEVTTTPQIGDRVPLTVADRQGVVDPLTAMFMAAEMDGAPNRAACNRTLPIFDGYQRYDLELSFKRMDTVDIKPYSGPIVVCAVRHKPVAGHRTSDILIRFLSGREIEATLAPLAGVRFLAPIRISVASPLANLVIQAEHFGTHR
jgi:hypothetical protein